MTSREPPPRLSVVVPVCNEEAILAASLKRIVEVLDRMAVSWELIAVDDGSRDRSPEILARFAGSEGPRLSVVTLPENRGKGAAVRTGMLKARGELRVFLDADLAVGPEALPLACAALRDGADLVIASRHHPESRVVTPQRAGRAVLGGVFLALARRTLGLDASDVTCGFKGFRAAAAQRLFGGAVVDGWAFDAELLDRAQGFGLRCDEIPVEWRDGPSSGVSLPGATWGAVRDLIRIRLRRRRDGDPARSASGEPEA